MYGLYEELLPWVAAFLLLDAAANVRPGQRLLVAWWHRFRAAGPGLQLLPLTPGGRAVLLLEPTAVVEHGVFVAPPRRRLVDAPGQAAFVPFAGAGEWRAEQRTVRAGRRAVASAPGAAGARAEAERLGTLSGVKPTVRLAERRRLTAAGRDLARVRQRLAEIDAALRPVTVAGTLLAAALVALPACLLLPADSRPAPALPGLAFVGAWALQVACAARAARRIVAPPDRVSLLLPLVFFPPGAIAAARQLSREALAGVDPLAAAAALLDRETFRVLAARERCQLEAVHGEAQDPRLQVWWDERRRDLDEILAQAGLGDTELTRPPRPPAASAAAWCPLCAAEYREGFERCADCDVPLRRVDEGSGGPGVIGSRSGASD